MRCHDLVEASRHSPMAIRKPGQTMPRKTQQILLPKALCTNSCRCSFRSCLKSSLFIIQKMSRRRDSAIRQLAPACSAFSFPIPYWLVANIYHSCVSCNALLIAPIARFFCFLMCSMCARADISPAKKGESIESSPQYPR